MKFITRDSVTCRVYQNDCDLNYAYNLLLLFLTSFVLDGFEFVPGPTGSSEPTRRGVKG